MKMNVEDLPKCQLIFRGHTIEGIDNEIIEEGDVFQIIASRSKFHKVVGIFTHMREDYIVFHYNDMRGYSIASIMPGIECLTWSDFSFKKINSLDEIIK